MPHRREKYVDNTLKTLLPLVGSWDMEKPIKCEQKLSKSSKLQHHHRIISLSYTLCPRPEVVLESSFDHAAVIPHFEFIKFRDAALGPVIYS